MSKSELFVSLAQIPEGDPRLARIAAVLAGTSEPEAPAATGPLFLGMRDGAKLLGVSRATFWRIVAAGRIERVELYPSSYRVRRADVERLAERGQKEKTARPEGVALPHHRKDG